MVGFTGVQFTYKDQRIKVARRRHRKRGAPVSGMYGDFLVENDQRDMKTFLI
jgi:hypothetical protein